MPENSKAIAGCTGVAPKKLSLPLAGKISPNNASASAKNPKSAAGNSLQSLQTLASALPAASVGIQPLPSSASQKSLDTNAIANPLTMTPAEKKNLKYGANVDLLVQDPNNQSLYILAAVVPAKMLAAFSEVARFKLNGVKLGEQRAMAVDGVSDVVARRMASYLGAACSVNVAEMPTIYTNKMTWPDWVAFWGMAESLDMPAVTNKLLSTVKYDIRALNLEDTLDVWNQVKQKSILTPQPALEGRLFGFARGKINDIPMELADLQLMHSYANDEEFMETAVKVWAARNYASSSVNDDNKVSEVCDALQTRIIGHWGRRRRVEQSKAQAAAQRRQDNKEREKHATLTVDKTTGQIKKVYWKFS